MCKFHKDVARAISQNPDLATPDNPSGFDAGTYAVALVATKMRIEEYMPEMFGCDGFVPKQMITDDSVQSFSNSSLAHYAIANNGKAKNFESLEADIQAFSQETLPALHEAMKETASVFDLSEEALNLPTGLVTEQGYKEKPCHKPDPRQNGPFLDEAVVDLFEGYHPDIPGYANGRLRLLDVAHKPEFEPLRAAGEHFLSQPGVEEKVEALFERSIVLIFQRAPQDVENGVGYETTDGCGMCLRQTYQDVAERLIDNPSSNDDSPKVLDGDAQADPKGLER